MSEKPQQGKVRIAKTFNKVRVQIDGKTGQIMRTIQPNKPKGKLDTSPKLRQL